MIHQPLSPDGVHPQIISSLRLLVLCLFRPEWFVINYCLFIFFKELVSFIGSLDKCHTSVFNALIVTGDSARYRTKPILSYAWFFNVLREQHRRSGPRFNVGFCPCRTCVSGFLTLVLTQLFFPKPPTTFLTCSAVVRGENTPERKFASTGYRTHNHQVMTPTRSPLSHPGRAQFNV